MDSHNEKTFGAEPPPYTDGSRNIQLQPSAGMAVGAPVVVGSPAVVHTTTTVLPMVVGSTMGPKPAQYVCPSCHAQIVTRVEYKTVTKTHLFAALLCALACWCCVCIPYCTDSCKNGDHYCPNCDAFIGTYNR